MQTNTMINYHIDDYYLIMDPNYNAEKFIGRINSIGQNGIVTLNIYIFPEDTNEGRKQHMSYYEIFLTKNEMSYQLSGNETQVNVTDLPNFIKRKYIQKEDLSVRQLYFQRQKYLENGQFEPALERICYCHQYFNPDLIFKTCNCGSYFHPICFMRSETNKCWNAKCNIDCSIFFSPEEMFDKKKKINQSQIQSAIPSNQPEKHSVVMSEDFFVKENGKNEYKKSNNNVISITENIKYDSAELLKKSKKKTKNSERNATIEMMLARARVNIPEREREIKIKQEPFINLGIKPERSVGSPIKTARIFDTTIYEKKPGGGYQIQIKSEPNNIEDMKKKTDSDREKARKIIFDNLLNGIKYLQKNPKILDDLENEKPNLKEKITLIRNNNLALIDQNYKELGNTIEKNLFKNCEEKTQGTYFFPFLQEFALLMKNSKNILFKVILGELSAEQISSFKGDDFLPEEKRKEKEELKNKEIQRMKFSGPMKIMAISNKGRMLTEIQDIIDVNKNYGLDTQINMNVEENAHYSEYYQKLKIMKEKYPNMAENDVKFLVEAKEPDEEEIQNRLNTFIQETLELDEQKELFMVRKKILQKKAERYFKKLNDKKNDKNEKNDKNDKQLLGKKVEDYIQSISFDIKPY